MSFRLFLLSVLLATAIAQETASRRSYRWRSLRHRTGRRTRTLRPTGGFFPTGASPTGVQGSGGLYPTSVTAPAVSSSEEPSYTGAAPSPSTVIVTTVRTTSRSTRIPVTTVPTTSDPAPAPTSVTSTTPASTSSTSSATAPATPTGGNTKKKGLSFTNPSQLTPWTGKNVGWSYNWWTTRGDVPAEMEYFPMMWCPTKLSVKAWTDAAEKAISEGSTRVLGFNEPDQKGQCDILPEDAAKGHIAYMNPLSGKAKIGSPAVTNGGGSSMGLGYQESFLGACDGACKIDFLNMHWYGDKQNAVYNFQLQVNKTLALGQKYGIGEVWVTEFGLNDGTDAEKADFVTKVAGWMDGMAAVGGYAYFMTSDGILNKGTGISPVLGEAYASA
ncbi:Phospholipase D1 [Sphaceloma murrayae]|uniref:Phospholipase D1 n=1 Tax=Sphaceloma murrayae TaxID=2082308 RepID=A0A2K1R1E1_9PEZI|nr:Phospholipase D1 [Sphaceloma murrayae]